MTIVLLFVSLVWLAGLVFVTSITPRRPELSDYELRRVAPDTLDGRRAAAYQDIVSVQRVLQALLLVAFVLTIFGALGWLLGGLTALIVSLQYGVVASMPAIRSRSDSLYVRYENKLLTLLEQYRPWLRWVRMSVPKHEMIPVQSRDELAHIVDTTTGVLSADEKKMILSGLRFDGKLVRDIMTPKSVVDTIKRSEVLGPLVLDDLHKTGHSRFPVIDTDIDHIVGILYVHDVLTLDTSRKHTAKVESAMSNQVHYIREDHTLKQALAAFLSTHHHLFIVINEYRETVGIITLEDTLEALLGRKIVDEFDAHDDMRQVAARNAASASALNRTKDSTDV